MRRGKQSEKDASKDAPGELRVLDAGRSALWAMDRLGHNALLIPLPDQSLRRFQLLLTHSDAHLGTRVSGHEDYGLLAGLVHEFRVQPSFAEAIL
jgi:hypothetical protein